MPEVETYGAQPPIELLRQLVDCGGYYDLKEKSWASNIVEHVVAAMASSRCHTASTPWRSLASRAGAADNGTVPCHTGHGSILLIP